MNIGNISNEIVIAYLNCRYKAQLLIKGMSGKQHGYTLMMEDLRSQYQACAIGVLFDRTGQTPKPSISNIDRDELRIGKKIISGGCLHHDGFTFHVDGLKKVSGKSALGAFHYIPILCYHENQLQHPQKLLLAYGAFVLGLIQERSPSSGIIFYGDSMASMTIRLDSLNKQLQFVVNELKQIRSNTVTIQLRLNKHCEQCEFRELCHSKAVEKDDLSLLARIRDPEIKSLKNKGIFTVNQLSYTYRYRRRPKKLKDQSLPFNHALQALAIREQRVYVLKIPDISKMGTRVFIDMEGDKKAKSIYLIGALVEDSQSLTSYEFWASNHEEESIIFEKLFDLINTCSTPHIFHYGSYETKALRRFLSIPKYKRKYGKQLHSDNVTNILSLIFRNIYFPTYSNRLKDIGRFLGYSWSSPDASGLYSIIWHHQWEATHDDDLKQILIQYNHDDCAALKCLVDYLVTITKESTKTVQAKDTPILVDSFKNEDDFHRWGNRDFVIPQLSKVIESAYFDYQQSKVFIRTSEEVRMAQRLKRKRQQHARHRVPNKTVWLKAYKCPRCKSSQISRSRDTSAREHSKLSLDLRITSSGIKRWIVRYRTQFHRCNECNKNFIAPSYASKKRFGHNLIAWTIYQHVAHNIPLRQLIIMIRECFDIRLQYKDIFSFKSIAVRYYKCTYNQLVRNLVAGELIHADETSMNITKKHGYVWVFANMKEAIYVFKPTRKGTFLKDFLSGFSGVLVSDFYAVYDSLPCRQQKCLIHLIWDINFDLRRNPFDADMKFIAELFGELLREIIETVDRFGLKTRFLKKHKVSARRFFNKLRTRRVSTEVAVHYQDRFNKNVDKLFTFLNYDGIPWNNNNAEHAIKKIAKFRRVSLKNTMSDKGLADYLLLLSIYMTCEYRGVSFLKFLLSKERDIDKYCKSFL